MQRYLAAAVIVLLLGMVLSRVFMLRRAGVEAMHFASTDRKDFLIPPFALFYFYTIFAAAFDLPTLGTQRFFHSEALAWIGVVLSLAGATFLLLALVSFGRSFRVGIDVERPDRLVTTGVFGVTRNPIYVAFALVLLGEFLVIPNWILLVYLVAGIWLFNRQVLREEEFMRQHYGPEYMAYCARVPRYLGRIRR